MSAQQKSLSEEYKETLPVHFLRTRNSEGEPCYFVLRTGRADLVQLLAKKGREKVDIAEYGEVLASGYGDHPNRQIVAMLKARYNIELPEGDE